MSTFAMDLDGPPTPAAPSHSFHTSSTAQPLPCVPTDSLRAHLRALYYRLEVLCLHDSPTILDLLLDLCPIALGLDIPADGPEGYAFYAERMGLLERIVCFHEPRAEGGTPTLELDDPMVLVEDKGQGCGKVEEMEQGEKVMRVGAADEEQGGLSRAVEGLRVS